MHHWQSRSSSREMRIMACPDFCKASTTCCRIHRRHKIMPKLRQDCMSTTLNQSKNRSNTRGQSVPSIISLASSWSGLPSRSGAAAAARRNAARPSRREATAIAGVSFQPIALILCGHTTDEVIANLRHVTTRWVQAFGPIQLSPILHSCRSRSSIGHGCMASRRG